MKKLRKTGLVLLVIIVVYFIAATVISFISKPWYYRLLYPWDRISGTISLEVDGNAKEIKAEQITAYDGREQIRIRAASTGESTKVSVHGGDYGPYCIRIEAEGISQPIEIICYQYNWWNTCEFDLHILIDLETNTISFASTSMVLNEKGEKVSEDHSLTLCLDNDILRFALVSV